MDIYLLRHGDAISAFPDFARELSEKGRRETRVLAQCLQQGGLAIDQMIVSPYIRAQQTADILFSHLVQKPARCTWESITPEGDATVVLDSLTELSDSAVMLVTHNPFVTTLMQLMAEGDVGSARRLPALTTSSIACLQGQTIAPGCMQLKWIKSPPDFESVKAF